MPNTTLAKAKLQSQRNSSEPTMADDKHHQQTPHPHCLILPYPLQGHINPMLQFAKRLVHKGLQVTLIATIHLAKTTPFSSPTIGLETISDGYDDGTTPEQTPGEYKDRFNVSARRTLTEVMLRLADTGRPVDCIIYDPFITWAPAVAREFGGVSAAFFTQSCAVDHIYYCIYKGELKVPVTDAAEISVPGLPPLRPEDLPSFLSVPGSYPDVFEIMTHQYTTLEEASWIFVNTFYELEEEIINYMSQYMPVKAIGPAVPSMFSDRRLPDDKEYGLSAFKPNAAACMDWLDQQHPKSVVYVSFGSLAKLGEAQMEEMAWGLKLSNKHFLWVVRSSELSKLPTDFSNSISDNKGLIVSWSPQLDVLAHDAISCFVTHCGWNSTLESVCLGVPLVGFPQWTDQCTNAKYVADVWKNGNRAPVGPDGLVDRETIARCINEVMDGEKGEEMRRNAAKWKELARAAVDEGGSSDKNIEEFASSLRSRYRNVVPNLV